MPVLKILSKIGVDLSFFVFHRADGLKGSAIAAVSQTSLQETLSCMCWVLSNRFVLCAAWD